MNNLKSFLEYLQLEKNYSKHTVTAYGNDLLFFQEFLKNNFDQELLENVNYSMIRSWIVSMVDAGVSNSSINRKISSLKAFYKFLLKTKQIETSPLLKHKSLKTPKKLQIPFSENELDMVLNNLKFPDGYEGIRDKLIIDLFYTTGVRRIELINLKMQNVDLQNATLKVYLSERAKLEVVTDSDYFFLLLKGVKLNDSFVYRLINYYFSHVSEKVKKSPHILRHTFATHLLNNGADLNSVKELLGHASLASTQVYTHSSLSELKKIYGQAHPRNKK